MTDKVTYNYEDSLKSSDTEEKLDLMFYRPIGYRWALLFAKLGVTPNAVSVMSIFLGVAAGVLFYFDVLWVNVVGMLLLIWANTFDSTDGQLARMTKQFSPIGRVLDGVSGDIWFIAIYVALCMRMAPVWGIYIWTLGALAGYWHVKQAALSDYYRNIHLHFINDASQSEFSDSEVERLKYESISFKDQPIQKVFAFFYKNYTKNQENMTPCMQTLKKALKDRFGDGSVSDKFIKAFREKSLPLMPLTNILTFNTRVIALFVSLIIGMPWLYFVFELVVLNIIMLYMYIRHERMCTNFAYEISEKKF